MAAAARSRRRKSSSALDTRGFLSGVLVKRVMKKISSARLTTPSTTNMLRQPPVRVCRPTATGAVSSAPSGVLSSPTETTKPRSLGVAQLATLLLITE
ncbi:hypothetical protein D3C75_784170 [compost metagenome]